MSSALSEGTQEQEIEAGLSAFGPRARARFEAATTEQELRLARAEILGKKGELTAIDLHGASSRFDRVDSLAAGLQLVEHLVGLLKRLGGSSQIV